MREKEISIIDLLVDILLHWRMFVIWMLVGSVLLGVFSYYRSREAVNNQKIQAEKSEMAPEEWLSKEEIQNVNYLIAYEKAYSAKETYLEKALLMNLDPNAINRADVTITIEGVDYQQSCNIKKVYEDIVQSGELVTRIAEDIGMEITGIDEMVFIDKDLILNGLTANSGNDSVSVSVSGDTNTFRIVAMNSDEAQCKAMLDAVIALLEEKHSDVEKIFGEHKIIVVNEAFGVVSDANIAKMQKTVLDDMTNMKRVISDARENLSDVEKQYYDSIVNSVERETGEESAIAELAVPHVSMKYVVLGAFMAAFLYAMVLFIIYIFNSKIRITDNLQELYDIPQFGMLPKKSNHKQLLGFIDKWFLSIQNRNKRQFTFEEALELAVVSAKMSAGKEALQEICLIGCGLKERSLDVCEKIKVRLEEEKIQVNILNNILYDARMMEELKDAKGVILVESIGSTLYDEIAGELEFLKRQQIKVLGGILVE